MSDRIHLWVSYPWIEKKERDFQFLMPLLQDEGIEAAFDSVELLPNVHLWERTKERLLSIDFDGWLYVLTHQCITRKDCADELVSAMDLAIRSMGTKFPMVGLVHGIPTQYVPLKLRARPCIPLNEPDWNKQVSSLFRHGSAFGKTGTAQKADFQVRF